MPSRTKAGLNLADKNSYVRVEENINDNLLKIDDDVDGTWGGLYGGYIEDPAAIKEVGKRYIGADGKAYICKVASNVNNTTNYTPCNVVDNLSKLNSLKFTATGVVYKKPVYDGSFFLSIDKYVNSLEIVYLLSLEMAALSFPANNVLSFESGVSEVIDQAISSFTLQVNCEGTARIATMTTIRDVVNIMFLDGNKTTGNACNIVGFKRIPR